MPPIRTRWPTEIASRGDLTLRARSVGWRMALAAAAPPGGPGPPQWIEPRQQAWSIGAGSARIHAGGADHTCRGFTLSLAATAGGGAQAVRSGLRSPVAGHIGLTGVFWEHGRAQPFRAFSQGARRKRVDAGGPAPGFACGEAAAQTAPLAPAAGRRSGLPEGLQPQRLIPRRSNPIGAR